MLCESFEGLAKRFLAWKGCFILVVWVSDLEGSESIRDTCRYLEGKGGLSL